MIELALSLFAFLGLHILPSRPAMRASLTGLAGERWYLAGYSLVSLIALGWVVSAAARAPVIALWPAYPALKLVTVVSMPLAIWLLVCGLMHPPPGSIRLSHARSDWRYVASVTRQPIFWAFAIWAFAHIPPNGALVPAVLFSLLGIFAIVGGRLFDRRQLVHLGRKDQERAKMTSFIPSAALLSGQGRWAWPRGDFVLSLLLAAGLYTALLLAHPLLFGAYPLAGLG